MSVHAVMYIQQKASFDGGADVGSLTEYCPQLMEIKAVSLLKKRRERFKGRTDVILITNVLDGLKTES